MTVFRWVAPAFKWSGRRWSDADFRLLADRLRPHVPPGGLLLDLGGGTGELGAGVAATLGAWVVIVDTTAQMLRRVEPRPSLSVMLAPAEALPFPDDHFDALLCSDAFHHFRDQAAAAAEMARVVRPGGGILLLEPDAQARGARILRLGERMLGEPGTFKSPREMEAFMAGFGVDGVSSRLRGLSYMFLGTVSAPPGQEGDHV
jgi:demethylmenaquinone methyltransferase/2-methoxy-6-polyprenyl-1,4-benzoquinol methylase